MSKIWLKHYPEGVPYTLTYQEIPLPELLTATARKYPEKTVLIFRDKTITYHQLDGLCNLFASSLANLGVKKGDRVALFLPNIPQFPVCYFGALRAGAAVVPCSPLYKARELEFQLNDSGAETIVALDTLCGIVSSVRRRTKLRNVITTTLDDLLPEEPGMAGHYADALWLGDLLERQEKTPLRVVIDPKRDPALFQYTGGTTGAPKAAILTHYNVVVNAVQFGSWLPTLREGGEIVLGVLPLFHIFGMTAAMNMPILKAEAIALLPKFEASQVLETIQRHTVTFFPGVPTMFIALINNSETSRYDLRSVHLCISGASSLPVEVMRRFEAITRGRLVEGYGLTEASPVTHCNPADRPDKVRAGSIGIPLPDTDAKIVDIETGKKDLVADEIGELVVRGPQVMAGYWNQAEETEHALRQGWLHTGDIAKMDGDGYFYIVDRKKDMINVSGLKVWPREVEEVLYEHPAVKEAAVVGVADPYRGESVKAYVVVREGFTDQITAQAIIQFCEGKIAAFKVPNQVELTAELPKTGVGKVLKRELKRVARP